VISKAFASPAVTALSISCNLAHSSSQLSRGSYGAGNFECYSCVSASLKRT
jgi:hypothetical protein